jgi:hypothetical protein
MLAHGARDMNRSLPPLPVDKLERYRRTFAVRGCVVGENNGWATKTRTSEAFAEDQSREAVGRLSASSAHSASLPFQSLGQSGSIV